MLNIFLKTTMVDIGGTKGQHVQHAKITSTSVTERQDREAKECEEKADELS